MGHRHRLFSLFLVFLMAIPASAQLGGLAGLGKKKDQPAKASDKPPEYSEKDKAKMAEIAQRPEHTPKVSYSASCRLVASRTAPSYPCCRTYCVRPDPRFWI